MGMRTRRTWTVVAVGLVTAVASAGCITPTPGGGGGGIVPPCPARQKLVVEQTDQTNFSLVRGVSANGRWVVTSRTIAGMLQLTLRELGSSDPGVSVGSIPADPIYDPHAVAVADDGSNVAYFRHEELGPRTFARWERASGQVETIAPPSPELVWSDSGPDGTLISWRATATADTVVVTDALTDELVGTGWERLANYDQGSASRSGRFSGTRDVSDASVTDIHFAIDAIGTAWADLRIESTSPDGSQFLLQGDVSIGSTSSHLWRVDADAQVLVDLGAGSFLGGQIADDGRAVVVRAQDPLLGSIALREFAADGSVSTLHTDTPVRTVTAPEPNPVPPQQHFIATPDLRTVVFTAFTTPLPPTAVVYASRCQ
jgi:hypothetical protein